MKKRTYFKKKIYACVVVIMAISIHVIFSLQKKESIAPHLVTKIKLNEAPNESSITLSNYPIIIAQQETMLWQELANRGITQEEYTKAQNRYSQAYTTDVEIMKKNYNNSTPLSENLLTLIHTVLLEFGLDPKNITIIPTNNASAAAAIDTALFINESSLQQYNLDVKKFAIAHECTHIKNKDHSTRYYIKRACLDKQQDITDWQHPYNKMRHLHEMRADITPCLKSLDYAQGCKQFYASHIQMMGDYESADQPKSSLRLATAKNIIQLMQNMNA